MKDETEVRARVARIVDLASQMVAGGDTADPAVRTAFIEEVNRLAGLPDGGDFLSPTEVTADGSDDGVIPRP